MGRYLGLLRAVNVGGTGKLGMAALREALSRAGYEEVRTLIASGNVVFTASGTTASLERRIEQLLADELELETDVLVRTAAEWRSVVADNPFVEEARRAPGKLVIVTLKKPPPAGALAAVLGRKRGAERIELRGRQAYVFYPDGIGVSKLDLSPLGVGTARNFNTVTKLVALL